MSYQECKEMFELPRGEEDPSSDVIEKLYQKVQQAVANIDRAIVDLNCKKARRKEEEKYLHDLFYVAVDLEGAAKREIKGYGEI